MKTVIRQIHRLHQSRSSRRQTPPTTAVIIMIMYRRLAANHRFQQSRRIITINHFTVIIGIDTGYELIALIVLQGVGQVFVVRGRRGVVEQAGAE